MLNFVEKFEILEKILDKWLKLIKIMSNKKLEKKIKKLEKKMQNN